MNQTYEDALGKIPFYKKYHPEFKPFIGERFDTYKILQVGESHYIGQIGEDPKDPFPLPYFDKWWEDPCEALCQHPDPDPAEGLWGSWYNTREVVCRFLTEKSGRGYNIFANMLRAFERVYLDRGRVTMTAEIKQDYQHFAFMNFFQMPALYWGEAFEASLTRAAKKQGDERLKEAVYKKAKEESARILDQVIDILKPEAVIITSKAAYSAYCELHGDDHDCRVIEATHPCSRWWYRKSGEDRMSGRERLEKQLLALRAAKGRE